MKRFSLLLILILFLSGINTYAQGFTGVEPAEAIQGDSLTVTISGQGNNFMQSSMFNIFFSPGLSRATPVGLLGLTMTAMRMFG